MKLRAHHVPSLAATLLLLMAGCGGGGGGDGTGDPGGGDPGGGDPVITMALYGEYRVVMLSASSGLGSGVDAHVTVSVGAARADGVGGLALDTEAFTTDSGLVTEPRIESTTIPYAEAETGLITLSSTGSGPARDIAAGYVSGDGGRALLASVEPMSPGIIILNRAAPSVVPGALAGDFYSVMAAAALDGSVRGTALGSVHLYEDGEARHVVGATNFDGRVTPVVEMRNASWVNLGGSSYTFGFAGVGQSYVGGLALRGDLLLLGGSTVRGEGPAILFFLRTSADRTNADFDGAYYGTGLYWRPSDGHYLSYAGSITSDGAGRFGRSLRINDEGSFGLGAPLESTYAVGAEGELMLQMGGIGRLSGLLSADGDFAVLGGGTASGDPPGVLVLTRR